MSEAYHCDEDDALEILKRIPNNPSTMPVRQWVTGSLPSEHLGIDDCIEALLWSDHGVVLRATEGHIADRIYYVDHHGDLRAKSEEGLDVESPNEAAVMLDSDLDAEGIDVIAVLAEDAPEPVRSIGKEIVTDGGVDVPYEIREQFEHAPLYCTDCELAVAVSRDLSDGQPMRFECSCSTRSPGSRHPDCWVFGEDKDVRTDGGQPVSDPGARVYCPACKSWNSHDDGDCSICGQTIAETEAEETCVGHCKHDDTDVYAGRGQNGRDMLSVAEPGKRGWLGNPFMLDDHSRAESIDAFRQAFEDKLQRDDEFRAAVGDLAGKTLGCWCQHVSDSEPGCHAEVIAEWADRLANEGDAALDDADRIVTDGGRPPLRRCSECGLIHRPTEACRAANGGGD